MRSCSTWPCYSDLSPRVFVQLGTDRDCGMRRAALYPAVLRRQELKTRCADESLSNFVFSSSLNGTM